MIRLLSICSLSVLYLALTLNALTCGLQHGFMSSGEDMSCILHGGQPTQSIDHSVNHAVNHSGGMDHSGMDHSDGAALSMVLCACLDNLTAAGAVLPQVALLPPDLPRLIDGYTQQPHNQAAFRLPPSRGPPHTSA